MHNEILILLLQLFLLLTLAKLMAELAQRLNLPIVVGEIFAGIIIGPSLLGSFQFYQNYFQLNFDQKNYLDVFTLLGSMLLLFIAGFHSDIKIIKHYSRKALLISFVSFIISFGFTLFIMMVIADNFLPDAKLNLLTLIFVAATLAISAISVLAKVLIDMDFIRRDFGQLAIAIGVIDETIIWISISVILGLAAAAEFSIQAAFLSTIKVLGFIVISVTAGKFIIEKFVELTQRFLSLKFKYLTFIFLTIFFFGLLSSFLNLEPVLGAFIAGLIFAQIPSFSDDSIEKLDSITFSFFAPLFFAISGLRVDIRDFANVNFLSASLLILFFSSVGKALGAYFSARFVAKFNYWSAISFSIGLNTRGTIQIIIASIGLTTGIISQEIFSLIIVISVLSSLTAPVLMKFFIKKIEPTEEELLRLRRENTVQKSILSKLNRVLVPVRLRKDFNISDIKNIETILLEKINKKKQLQVSLLTVVNEQEKVISERFLENLQAKLETLKVNKKVLISDKPLESILDELSKGYDLLVVGATEKTDSGDSVINPFVDNLIRMAPCQSLIIHSPSKHPKKKLSKILVPVDGSLASKKAAELAFSISDAENDEVHLLRVIEQKSGRSELLANQNLIERQYEYAKAILDSIKSIGDSFQIKTFNRIEIGEFPEEVILRAASEYDFDLVVLGTELKPGTDKLYLGPRVERILDGCTCPVAVFNSQ
ncbi:cation:proton antiporter [Ignavibacterium sp.]|uniref:cation:proton antiporter domain-containing protein n=1 Tax=Ignavibacterium sp. TaxID=2651167 RepID=UPI00307DBA5A